AAWGAGAAGWVGAAGSGVVDEHVDEHDTSTSTRKRHDARLRPRAGGRGVRGTCPCGQSPSPALLVHVVVVATRAPYPSSISAAVRRNSPYPALLSRCRAKGGLVPAQPAAVGSAASSPG